MTDLIWKKSSKYKSFFSRSIHFLYGKLVAPRSLAEDDKRREFILNIILLGTILLLAWSELYLIQAFITDGESFQGMSLIFFSSIFAAFILLYIFSLFGHFNPVSYILIAVYFISIGYAAYHWGANMPAALLSFGLLIVISSIL